MTLKKKHEEKGKKRNKGYEEDKGKTGKKGRKERVFQLNSQLIHLDLFSLSCTSIGYP